MAKTHSVYYPLYNDKTHFIYLITGSRASGKSFSASQFIERLTFEYNAERKIAHKILYTRYTMVSAAISVIPEVKEKIEIDGTGSFSGSITASSGTFTGTINADSGNIKNVTTSKLTSPWDLPDGLNLDVYDNTLVMLP